MVLVWTATCREMHDNRLRGIVFTNEHGQKRNVTMEDMEDFFKTHYVSNLVYSGGRLKGIGISLEQLDTYNLRRNGQYRITPGIGETNVYALAAPYINNQRVKIKQDKAQGNLKTDEQQSSDNNDGGLTGTQKLAVATAVAGATVVGVNKIAKVVNKQLNSKRYAEIKQETYDKLSKYQTMIEELIRVKNETNKIVQNNPSIVRYSSEFESRQALTNNTKNNILQYGIVGCITNINDLLNQSSQSIQAYNLMDEHLDDIGITGTLRAQFSLVSSRLNNLKQLHLRTKQLVENNIQRVNQTALQERQIAQQVQAQQDLISTIENELHIIESKLLQLQSMNNPEQSLQVVKGISTQSIKSLVASLTDENKKNEYSDYIYSIDSQLSEKEIYYNNEIRLQVEEASQESNRQLTYIATTISDLKNGRYNGDEAHRQLDGVIDAMNRLELSLPSLEENTRKQVASRLQNIRTKWSSDELKINQSIETANQLVDDKKQLEQYISTLLPIIEKLKLVDSDNRLNDELKIQRDIYSDNYAMLNRLKRKSDEETKHKISDIECKLNEAKIIAGDNIRSKKEERDRIVSNTVDELKVEFQRIKDIIVDDSVTEQDIADVVADTSIANSVTQELGFTQRQIMQVEMEVNKINRECNNKKDAMAAKIRKKQQEAEALQAKIDKVNSGIESDLTKIEIEIDLCPDSITQTKHGMISRKLTGVLGKYDVTLVKDINLVKSRIQTLMTKLDNKLATQ